MCLIGHDRSATNKEFHQSERESVHGTKFALSISVWCTVTILQTRSFIPGRCVMRRLQSIDQQGTKPFDVKRLRELEQENSLLKLLYTDLLQKFSALKDGVVRSEGVC